MKDTPIIGFKMRSPQQWVDFKERYPDEFPERTGDSDDWQEWMYRGNFQVLHDARFLLDGLPYKHDRTDVWNVSYDLRPVDGSFDCDDSSLTFCSLVATQVGSYHGLWPTICLNANNMGHMVVLIGDHPFNQDIGWYVSDYGGVIPFEDWAGKPLMGFDGKNWRAIFRSSEV